jgi:signal transduction histidine kinase
MVVVFAADDQARRVHEEALAAAGARARVCTEADVLTVVRGAPPDAAIFDVGQEPERWAILTAARREIEDLGTRAFPVLVTAPPEVSLARVAPFGGIAIAAGDEAALLQRLGQEIERQRLVTSLRELSGLGDRVEALGRARDAFSHDARVLLGIALGFACNLRDHIAGPMTAMQEEHVKHVLDAINDLGKMLDRHVETEAADARAGAGAEGGPSSPGGSGTFRLGNLSEALRARPRRALIDFGKLARETAQLFGYMAAERGVAIDVDAVGDVSVWGDSVALKQVITNLVVNAIKLSPRGGKLRLSLGRRAPEDRASEETAGALPVAKVLALREFAELVVEDEGPGVPVADRERIFERGTRLPRDLSTPGSGIGLAVVRASVEAHRGEVLVRDRGTGTGAAFVVRLPLDMRARTTNVLLVKDAGAAQDLLAAMGALRSQPLDTTNLERLRDLVLRCAAVVVTGASSGGGS